MTWLPTTLHLPEEEEVEEDCSLQMRARGMYPPVAQMWGKEQCLEVVLEEEANLRVRAICSELDQDHAVCQNQTLKSENLNQICTKNPPTWPVVTMTIILLRGRELPAEVVAEVSQDCSEQDPDLAVGLELGT